MSNIIIPFSCQAAWLPRIFALAVCLLLLPNIAMAQGFLSRYDGTTIRLNWTTTHPVGEHRVSRSVGTATISKSGIGFPGLPTFKNRDVHRKNDGYGGTEERVILVHENGFTFETSQNNNKLGIKFKSSVTVNFVGNACSVVASSNYWKATVNCTIVKRSRLLAKDDPRACRIVRDAINEIRSLAPAAKDRDTLKGAVSCDKMNKITKSIKGAGCPSLFSDVDAALGDARKSCKKINHPLAEIGIRG